MTGWFIGPPPPVNGVWAGTQAEAWRIYDGAPGEYGYPVPVGGRWLVPRPVGVVDARLAAEAAAVNDRYGPMMTLTPGSSKERAKLQDHDRRRIAEQAARQRRPRTDREEPVTTVQASLF